MAWNIEEKIKELAAACAITYKPRGWFIWFGFAIVVGTILRLYLISDQILVEDEWHGNDYVINKSFFYLLTHFSIPGATCIPLNLYRLFLLKTFGWSEFLLVLPSIVAGILSMVVIPLLFIKKIFSRFVTVIFVFLLAISPYLVFYSRVCRPYSVVAFLGFVCILSFYLWAVGYGRKYAVCYLVTGVLAVYFHLFALVAVFVPLVSVFIIKFVPRSVNRRDQLTSSLGSLAFLGSAVVVLLCLILLPALLQSSTMTVVKEDRVTVRSLIDFACFLSGTSKLPAVITYCVFLVLGVIRLLRRKPVLTCIFVNIILMYFVILLLTGPDCISDPHVFARYAIVVFPISFILAAFGIEGFTQSIQSVKLLRGNTSRVLGCLIAAALLFFLFRSGPLNKIYSQPNNYLNHPMFFNLNQPFPWEQPFTGFVTYGFAAKEQLPGFYKRLADEKDVSSIIEYPVTFSGDRNLYYQRFHKKKIIAGYTVSIDSEKSSDQGYITADMYPDQTLSRVDDLSKLKFRNMIDMTNLNAIRGSKADYIILHKNLSDEGRGSDQLIKLLAESSLSLDQSFRRIYSPVIYLNDIYSDSFGPAVYEDDNLRVFEISLD